MNMDWNNLLQTMDLDDLVTSIDIIDMFIFWVVLNLSHFRVSGSAMTPPPTHTDHLETKWGKLTKEEYIRKAGWFVWCRTVPVGSWHPWTVFVYGHSGLSFTSISAYNHPIGSRFFYHLHRFAICLDMYCTSTNLSVYTTISQDDLTFHVKLDVGK